MQFSRRLTLLVMCAVAASCAAPDHPAATTEPGIAARGASFATSTSSGGSNLRSLVQSIYGSSPNAGAALALYDNAVKYAGTPAGCASTLDLIEMTLTAYRTEGGLVLPAGNANLLPAVQSVLTGLNAVCPSVAPPSVPAGALSTNGAIIVVRARTTADVETIDGMAGILLPQGALSQDVVLMISRILTTGPGAGILNTNIESGPFYDITTYPHVSQYNVPVTIGLIQVGPYAASAKANAILAHLKSDGTTETPSNQGNPSCPVPAWNNGRSIIPSFLRSGFTLTRSSGMRAPLGPSFVFGAPQPVRDSSGTAGGCGSATETSPFGFVTAYDPNTNWRALSASYVCGSSFRLTNSGKVDMVAIWQGFTRTEPAQRGNPTPLFLHAGESRVVDVSTATPSGPLGGVKLSYGPVGVGVAYVPAVQNVCG